jgi:EcoRII C terminal
MKQGLLSEYFDGVAVKRLSAVEADPEKSHQHEFAGGHLKGIFGLEDRTDIPARFIWLNDEQEGLSEPGKVSWYDSRRMKAHRSAEYRLYYDNNPVASLMKPGDSFFVATRTDGTVMVIIVPKGSTVEAQLTWLFGINTESETFSAKDEIDDVHLDFAARYILDELGIEAEEPEADKLDAIIEKHKEKFPTTTEFAKIARDSLREIDAKDDADKVLMAWLEREELLFRRLERHIVSDRLKTGFMSGDTADVDGFIAFSLSVQNRRKSRAGYSLEHHIEALLVARGVRYQRQVITEGKSKPDFLFPGQKEYHDITYKVEKLTMLGSKSTLKDRWRQVLDEADRITHKHLLTLEPGISEAQTDAMKNRNLQLVVPQSIHTTYKADQQKWLMNVANFIGLVEERQKA